MPSSRSHGPTLTERDHELFLSLLKYRYLATSQAARLHFASHQTAARRLRLLAHAGYVSIFTALGIDENLATLTARGARLVAERLLIPLTELGWTPRREEPKDYLFLRHFLWATDFRIRLTKACEARDDLTLLGFIPAHLGEKTPRGGVQKYLRDIVSDIVKPSEKIVHTPDGVFALQKDGTAALFFLESDRGTETLADVQHWFLKTIRFYLSYLLSGGYERYGDEFGVTEPFKTFRVLVLTSSAQRLTNIRTLCGKVQFEPEHVKRFLWLSSLGVAADGNLLEHSWVSLDPHDPCTYTIDPTTTGGGDRCPSSHQAQGTISN